MGKLLIFSILAYGHQNVGIMIASYLHDKYGDQHEIYILVDQVWKKRLEPIFPMFNYVLYENQYQKLMDIPKVSEDMVISKIKNINFDFNTICEQIDPIISVFASNFENLQLIEPQILKILENVKPDLIIADQICAVPYIMNSKIPWALLVSCNPLYFGLENLPPANSGLRMDEQQKWNEFRTIFDAKLKPHLDKLNEWYIRNNCREIRYPFYMYESPYFNIYCYPKEIDYLEPGKIEFPGKWFRLDSVVSPITYYPKLNLPEDFVQKPGKIIYFSLGSLFSAHFELIQKFLDIFKKLPHKFIVSKGPLGDSLELPENCWGDKFLNQKSVLQVVDLIISHGGNNTLNECFHYGVPMIIMPFSFDQHDNATRIQETGYGIKLNAFKSTESEIIDAINSMLSNDELIQKWKQISSRIQKNNGIVDLSQEILTYLNKNSNEQ